MIIVDKELEHNIIGFISWENREEFMNRYNEIYENLESNVFHTGPFHVAYSDREDDLIIITDSEQTVSGITQMTDGSLRYIDPDYTTEN